MTFPKTAHSPVSFALQGATTFCSVPHYERCFCFSPCAFKLRYSVSLLAPSNVNLRDIWSLFTRFNPIFLENFTRPTFRLSALIDGRLPLRDSLLQGGYSPSPYSFVLLARVTHLFTLCTGMTMFPTGTFDRFSLHYGVSPWRTFEKSSLWV